MTDTDRRFTWDDARALLERLRAEGDAPINTDDEIAIDYLMEEHGDGTLCNACHLRPIDPECDGAIDSLCPRCWDEFCERYERAHDSFPTGRRLVGRAEFAEVFA